ncbi:MAG: LytR/AlgR family response regulator transcription factor [Desulfonatronovibrionaceae bacterium]
MSALQALIVHSDREVTAELRDMLAQVEEIRVLGEAVSSFEALELLERIKYDVFFVGLDLPQGMDGIELAQVLSQRRYRPAMVYVADREDMAFKAFEVGATDYLLLPLSRPRLEKTVERLMHAGPQARIVSPDRDIAGDGNEMDEEMVHLPLADDDQDKFLQALNKAWDYRAEKRVNLEKLAINIDGKLLLIPYNQIIFIEAYEDYSYVHTSQEKFLTSYRLKNLEERLRDHRFFRVHRKYLVNLDMVTEIASLPGSNFMLRTAGRKRIELPISRRRIGQLKQLLGL